MPSSSTPSSPASSAGSSPSAIVQTLRMLVGAVVAALFLMAVALSFVLGFAAPPWWAVAVLLVLGVLVHVGLDAFGYRAKPVDAQLPLEQARQEAVRAFRTTLMIRLAAAESVALVGLLLAFLAGRTVLVYDVGAAVCVLLLALHVWPSLRTVDKTVAALERDGARTGLRELLGYGPAGGARSRTSGESG